MLATVPIGLAARYAPLHLPWFWQKYLGSALWAVALYWFIAIFRTRWQPDALCTFTSAAAILIELTRLTPQPQMDAFRLTLAGKLLLGRYFSFRNIAAYLIAIALTAWADRKFHPGRIPASTPSRPSPSP
jgi:hypothetical protein